MTPPDITQAAMGQCPSQSPSPEFFRRDVLEVARDLIGCRLLVDGVGGIVVETEAYSPSDPASHAFRGPTARNAAMFGPPGIAYVYRSHGLHWCLNIVCGFGPGAAALIRALEPTDGVATMAARRGTTNNRLLCAGPGRLCQALGVTLAHNALPLTRPPFDLVGRAGPLTVATGRRIGISKAQDYPWRVGLAGSRYLSRPIGREP